MDSAAELAQLRETVKRLNRRCQAAESAARETVERNRKAGSSFGRALANWAAADYRRQLEAAQARVNDLEEAAWAVVASAASDSDVERLRDVLLRRDK